MGVKRSGSQAIEIRGVNSVNYGALLMFKAASRRLEKNGYSVAVDGRAISVESGALRLPRLESRRLGGSVAALDSVIQVATRPLKSYATVGSLVGLLDCSGFVFSDRVPQYPAGRAVDIARSYVKSGKPVIAMPQSFGPFSSRKSKNQIRQFVELSTAVFVRDSTSIGYLLDAGVPQSVLRRCPDMTITLEPDDLPEAEYQCTIVPSKRLVDRRGGMGSSYEDFLHRIVGRVNKRGLDVQLLCHETHDRDLVERLGDELSLSVAHAPDPLTAKRILGSSRLVIASRYHAAISALSMGVPTMTIGWAHKYGDLIEDFGEGCATLSNIEELDAFIAGLDSYSASIANRVESLRRQVDHMWTEVFDLLLGQGIEKQESFPAK